MDSHLAAAVSRPQGSGHENRRGVLACVSSHASAARGRQLVGLARRDSSWCHCRCSDPRLRTEDNPGRRPNHRQQAAPADHGRLEDGHWQPLNAALRADDQALSRSGSWSYGPLPTFLEASARCAYSTSSHGATAKTPACEQLAVKHDQISPWLSPNVLRTPGACLICVRSSFVQI